MFSSGFKIQCINLNLTFTSSNKLITKRTLFKITQFTKFHSAVIAYDLETFTNGNLTNFAFKNLSRIPINISEFSEANEVFT